MISLTLSGVGLTDQDVLNLPSSLGQKLDTLGAVFNELTDLGLATLLTLAPALSSLDLEGNVIKFDPTSEGVDRLWGEESQLLHLNMSCNSFIIRSFIQFLWIADRSQLETLDRATSQHNAVQATA